MNFYRAFGITIGSELPLPELSPAQSGADCEVRIVLRDLGLIVGAAAVHHRFSAQRQTFIYPRIGAFIITDADEIAVEVAPGANPNLVALPLLGPVMGVLLHLRGRFVLHGSAVEFGSAGYGFVGDKGAGKSTLAAALVGSGAALLSDDLLAFDDNGAILPAFPQLKLSSEALAMSGGVDARVMPSPAEGFPKHQLRLAADVSAEPVAPHGIYEIRRDDAIRIERFTPAEALKALMRFSYLSRFATWETTLNERRRLFDQASRLVNTVEVGRLFVPNGLDGLPLVQEVLARRRT